VYVYILVCSRETAKVFEVGNTVITVSSIFLGRYIEVTR
jgi:hypothetical protein